jgi:hypothetical protein
MTLHQAGRTVLFMAPPAEEEAEPFRTAPRASDEEMRRLRDPFDAGQRDEQTSS